MEISIYQVHHIVARYLRLRHCVYFLSDWLVFFCSFLCCQCAEYWVQDLPSESLSDASIATYQMVPRRDEVDTGLSCGKPSKSQHIMIDFEQTEPKGSMQKCTELWSLVDDGQELKGAILESNLEPPTLTELTDNPATSKTQVFNESRDEYPAVHNVTRPQEQYRITNASFTI